MSIKTIDLIKRVRNTELQQHDEATIPLKEADFEIRMHTSSDMIQDSATIQKDIKRSVTNGSVAVAVNLKIPAPRIWSTTRGK